MSWFTVLALVGCGHTLKAGAGPMIDSDGNTGMVVSGELGTHLLSARAATLPVAIRAEAAVTSEGVQGLVGFTYGVMIPARGQATRTEPARGWSGRGTFGVGAWIDGSGVDSGWRGALALTRGQLVYDRPDGDGMCLGSHEKSRMCHAWDRWRYANTGVEVATTLRVVGSEGEEPGLDVIGWRMSLELVHERGTLRDLDAR